MTMTIAIIMTSSVKVIYVVIFSNLATLLRIHDKLKNSNQEGEKSYFPETAICKGTSCLRKQFRHHTGARCSLEGLNCLKVEMKDM